MRRSRWKRPYVETTFLKKIENNNSRNEIKTTSRNSEILPNFVDKIFDVHNGNGYTTVLVTNEMIGHKFGEFAFTRKKFIYKKK